MSDAIDGDRAISLHVDTHVRGVRIRLQTKDRWVLLRLTHEEARKLAHGLLEASGQGPPASGYSRD